MLYLMRRLVKKYLPVLKRITKLIEKAKRDHVRKCDREFLESISECANYVLQGNVVLTNRQKTKLRRSRNDLRALSIKKTSLRKKRRILQKGGFLGTLWPPVLTILSELFLK